MTEKLREHLSFIPAQVEQDRDLNSGGLGESQWQSRGDLSQELDGGASNNVWDSSRQHSSYPRSGVSPRLSGDGDGVGGHMKEEYLGEGFDLRFLNGRNYRPQELSQQWIIATLAALVGAAIGAALAYFTKSESTALKDLRKERNSLKKQLKTVEDEDKPKLEKKINDLNAQIAKKETEIKSLKNTNAITKKKLAEAEDKEGILKVIEILPKSCRAPVRTRVKAFFKQVGTFGTKAVKSSKNQYNRAMKLFTRKRSSSKGKGKSTPKTAANKPKTSTAMTAKNN